ncbi:Uncharacterised protein [Klebsiella michiganensis]|uniref:Uncharacterized protein n=1 Tax=Klebsiella michiganensis TaxID=1134687 RepID=A0A7H4N3E5_9ENTR|nr:Uncharacterised protein [Klebsiella michiganensis]
MAGDNLNNLRGFVPIELSPARAAQHRFPTKAKSENFAQQRVVWRTISVLSALRPV